MKILQVHNFYQQPGGEDSVLAAENELLRSRGHDVLQYTLHNDSLTELSLLSLAARTVWSHSSYKAVRAVLQRERPQIVHAHNTFPLISPSLYYAAAREHVPVVQSLHNYRLICPAATLSREGHPCEDCVGRIPLPGAVHKCYRNNAGASATVAGMLTAHRVAGTWRHRVDKYIALTEFARERFIRGGLPAHKIAVKPNCLPVDPSPGEGRGRYALFAGRLTPEKGFDLLLSAWKEMNIPVVLKVAGEGVLRSCAEGMPNVEVLGLCSHERVLTLMQDAAVVVFPSILYEGLPMIIVEAFACGTPVAVSSLPSMDELVVAGETGMRFRSGDAKDLAAVLDTFFSAPGAWPAMRTNARNTYQSRYTAKRNYSQLIEIYTSVQRSQQNGRAISV